MKLVRFGEEGKERPGVLLDDGRILDVRTKAFHIQDYNEHFFAHDGVEQVCALLEDAGADYIPSAGVRLGAPVARPANIICVGANYADHAKEFGHPIPDEPVLFSKATTSLNGPFDTISLPLDAKKVDSEAELAVVIGRKATRVSEADALNYVAGYTVLNDVTERVVQRRNGQWFRGKSFDGFCPLGPWLVTPDEVGDVQQLDVWQKLNGKTLQRGNTQQMIFLVPYLIAYISAGVTLLPGDIISTGTPAGIGSAHTPPVLMKPGDCVEIGVDGLGAQRTLVR